ncbi:hypothetical protein ABPG72_021003 [Tetrahymena utriculariae]
MKALNLLVPKMLMQSSATLFMKPSFNISFLKKGLEKMKEEQEQKLKNLQQQQQAQSLQLKESEKLQQKASTQQVQNPDPYQNASSDKISDELAEQMRDQQLQDELEFEELSKQHKLLQANVSKECDIPFRLYGMLKMPKTKAAYMPERVFAEQRIPKYMVIDHLKKIYLGTLHSIVDLDEEFLNEYLEAGFAKKLIERIKELKNQGYKLELYQDNNGIRGEPITQETYLGDMVMVRGLSIDRSKNLSQNDYHMWKDIEDMGLVVYTPRYLSNPDEFINPEKNKTIYDDYKKVIMRVLVYLKNPYRIRIIRPDGTPIKVDDNLYTWEHIALFETQMRLPPQFKSDYKLENYMEWLGKFNFGVWRMADLDNWNLGNPLIVKDSDRDKFKDEVFKESKYDPEYNIDIKNV